MVVTETVQNLVADVGIVVAEPWLHERVPERLEGPPREAHPDVLCAALQGTDDRLGVVAVAPPVDLEGRWTWEACVLDRQQANRLQATQKLPGLEDPHSWSSDGKVLGVDTNEATPSPTTRA